MSHYDVLGLAPDASLEDIEHAFRRLARQIHPDRHGGAADAEQRMKELNEIRATLVNPSLRAAYDVTLGRTEPTRSRPLNDLPITPRAETRPGLWMLTPRTVGGGWLLGAGLALMWGPMLRSEGLRPRTTLGTLTGLALGVLAAVIRWPPSPVLGSALVGLLVSVPYGVVEHTFSSMVGGAVIGGLVGWAVRWGD